MRRTLLYYGLAALAVGAIFLGCRRDRLGGSDGKPEPGISVQDARSFFEQQAVTTKAAAYLNADSDHPHGFSPGDFTPLWDRATRAAANQWVEGVDLPIDPKFIFTAVFKSVSAAGDTLRTTVDITQKLVINRWHNHPRWEGLYAYIATIIPAAEYAARHNNIGRSFVNLGEKRDFSGVVVYHNLEGRFVNADKYNNGVVVAQVYDEQGTGIDQQDALHGLLGDRVTLYGGTPQAYRIGIESDEIDVTACQRCGTQGCKCKAGGRECACKLPVNPPPITPPDPLPEPKPDPIPPGGGTSPKPDPSKKLLKPTGLSESQQLLLDHAMGKLNKNCMANWMMNQMMANDRTLSIQEDKTQTAKGRYQAGTIRIQSLDNFGQPTQHVEEVMIHEIFHGYQDMIYGDNFNETPKGDLEFEAYLVTNIVMGSNGYPNYILPPIENEIIDYWIEDFAGDVRSMTTNFHGRISPADIQILYDRHIGHFKLISFDFTPVSPSPDLRAVNNVTGASCN